MAFNSIVFIYFFFPIVTFTFFVLPKKWRALFIFLINILFYSWGDVNHLYLLLSVTIINYWLGQRLDKKKNLFVLRLGITINILVLIYFKYFNFMIANIKSVLQFGFEFEKVLLPLGISFYIFKSISYLVDIYKVRRSPLKHFIEFGAYFTFFPTIISGPISRHTEFSESWLENDFNYDNFYSGLERFIFGLSKKMILANSLGIIVDKIYTQLPFGIDTLTAWLGIAFYGLQLYFDFSGYSDMAIGFSRILGISLPENFNYPYLSKSVTEFWRRWHITLSSWFRDYVYIPLGGNRTGNVYFNLIVVFILTGLWHGSNWVFLIWGLWHGFAILFERRFRDFKVGTNFSALNWAITMVWVFMGWVFFRSADLKSALDYLSIAFGIVTHELPTFTFLHYLNTWVILVFILSLLFSTKNPMIYYLKFPYFLRSMIILSLLVINILFIVNSTYSPFIYFQF